MINKVYEVVINGDEFSSQISLYVAAKNTTEAGMLAAKKQLGDVFSILPTGMTEQAWIDLKGYL